MTAGLASTAGCLDLLLGPQGGPGGAVPGAEMTYRHDVSREDADVEVASAAELASVASSGAIVWVPSDATVDLTGRNLTVRNGTVIASGRGGEGGESGAVLTTTDRGRGSPTRSDALINLEDGRVTGLTIRGPLFNYTASQVIPGYVPFAPGGGSNRAQWRGQRVCRGVSMQHDAGQIDNCEIWGWSTGVMVGARHTAVSPTISHCHVHNCMMMSLGYCVDVKRGAPLINKCRFNAYRHAVNGYGTADAGYRVVGCVLGPHVVGHHIDMHSIGENEGGSGSRSNLRWRYRAGGTMIVQNSVILGTRRVGPNIHNGTNAGSYEPDQYIWNGGTSVPAVRVRGVPTDGMYFEGNQVEHDTPQSGISQTGLPGDVTPDENGWYRVFVSGNQWGVQMSPEEATQGHGQGQDQPAPPTEGEWLREDFEGGADNMIEDPNDTGGYVPDHPDAVRVPSGFAREGNRALRLQVDYNWNYPSDVRRGTNKPIPNGRDMMQENGYSVWGEPFWFQFSLGLPPDWQPDGHLEQVHEFHRDLSENPGGSNSARKDYSGSQSGKPVSTVIDGRELQFRNDWTENGQEQEKWITAPVTLQAGQWYDILFNITWSSEAHDYDGFMKIWVNGEQAMNHTGNTTARDVAPPRPPELRIYKWLWNQSDVTPDTRRRVYYFDDVRWGFGTL